MSTSTISLLEYPISLRPDNLFQNVYAIIATRVDLERKRVAFDKAP